MFRRAFTGIRAAAAKGKGSQMRRFRSVSCNWRFYILSMGRIHLTTRKENHLPGAVKGKGMERNKRSWWQRSRNSVCRGGEKKERKRKYYGDRGTEELWEGCGMWVQ